MELGCPSLCKQSHHHEATKTQGGHYSISLRRDGSQRRRSTHKHFVLFGKHIRAKPPLLNGQPCQLWIPTHDFQLHLVVHIIRANNEQMTGPPLSLPGYIDRKKEKDQEENIKARAWGVQFANFTNSCDGFSETAISQRIVHFVSFRIVHTARSC